MNNRYKLPLVPLRGITIFPGMLLHFDVGRPKSIAAVEEAMSRDKMVFLCYQYDILLDEPEKSDLAKIGTVSEIKQILHMPDGNIRVLVEGLVRGKLTRMMDNDTYLEANVIEQEELPCEDDLQIQVLIRQLQHLMEHFLELYDRLSPEAIASLLAIEDPGEMADIVMANFPIKPQMKQLILDEIDVKKRLEKLIGIVADEIDILEIEKQVMDQVQHNIDQNQKEYVLREKLKVIQDELGEGDTPSQDIKKYRKQLLQRTLPKEVSEKLNEEFGRLNKTQPHSQEYAVVQNYIETVLSLPWDISTEETLDIPSARETLDSEHFGLEKVKERILEYIAVKQRNGELSGSILCLYGPPGTGKTSIAKSLARSLNRNYIRISLGGIQNESDIRGHRKTYVGAMPGRIMDGLKRAKANNPLILLDEIDKMSRSYNGDPSSAMLEVLDPEQNKAFRDHFIELDFDLSNVLFVTTANSLDTIPRPLLDRMDLIEVTGYTEEEKLQIGKRYLLPKQRKQHGLTAKELKLSDPVLADVITGYTRESGVRNLERKLATICRKAAKQLAEDNLASVTVTKKNLKDYLGSRIYHYEKADTKDKIGVATGLAWTEVGGDTLSIEVSTMAGSGKLELTGNLGDVMKESAKAAFSYVRANYLKLGLERDFYKKTDIHIHVPEGAIPKDGPSAGITMVTALTSALSGRPVKSEVAMTGEVTLRGRVLPIGGLKEKTLAAYRIGIKQIVIPSENKNDYDELPSIVKDSIRFTFARDMGTVLDVALGPMKHPKKNVLNPEVHLIDAGLENKKTERSAQQIN